MRLLRKVHLLWDTGEERSEKLKAEIAETFWCKVTEDKEFNPRVSVLIVICFVTKFLTSICLLMALPFLLEAKDGNFPVI